MRKVLPEQGHGQCSERNAGPVLEVEQKRLEIDGEEAYMILQEDLVERVLAMVPYPQICKVIVLSKSWFTRFSPISSLDRDEEKKQSAMSFQKRVSECSDKRKTFCPVFYHLVAYDRESQHWQQILTLSFLPEDHPVKSSYQGLEIEGALVLICTWLDPSIDDIRRRDPWQHGLHVANVLTRSWKQLPPHSHGVTLQLREAKLVSYKDKYKVILFCHYDGKYLAQTYDSQLEAWSDKWFNNTRDFIHSLRRGGKYFNGVLYWVGILSWVAPTRLVAYNVKEETLEVLDMQPIDVPTKSLYLVVCNASLLLVMYTGEASQFNSFDSVIVLKIDLELRRWVKVNEGPPYKLPRGSFHLDPVSDGDWIFLAGSGVDRFLAYNVQRDEWSNFFIPASIALEYKQFNYRFYPCSFRTGLNTFVAL